jgi:hypothetical protein
VTRQKSLALDPFSCPTFCGCEASDACVFASAVCLSKRAVDDVYERDYIRRESQESNES